MRCFIPQMEPWFDEAESTALLSYMQDGGWVTEFKKTQEFERLICEFTGAEHCIVTNNGTISLTLALLAAGVGPDDEVVVPDMTMIATPNSAKLLGARPVFVDIEPETLCMNIEQTAEAITDKTKAVIHVSLNGRCNDIFRLRQICHSQGVRLIEDFAQSLGSCYNGKHLGTIGDMGSLSFSAPKIITTGQGGALVTNDDELASKLRKSKDFGRTNGGNDIHDEIGFNFKFTDIQAVIGIEQMKKLSWRVDRKKEIYRLYESHLSSIEDVELIPTDLNQVAPWFIDIYVPNPVALRDYLKEKGVGSRTVYPPIHSQKAYQLDLDFPVTQHYARRGLWLPSASKLSDEDVHQVCGQIFEFFEKKR